MMKSLDAVVTAPTSVETVRLAEEAERYYEDCVRWLHSRQAGDRLSDEPIGPINLTDILRSLWRASHFWERDHEKVYQQLRSALFRTTGGKKHKSGGGYVQAMYQASTR